jgi:4-amino-4-deoxy-L-arabinose transferase-like glycosyltransferase
MLFWGRQWQGGYGKHPPLPAWLAEAAWWLSGGSVVGVYFLGYALIALAIWAVWRLARRMLPPGDALLAALSLEGIVFYTYWAYEYNNNVVLVAFWALTTLVFYRACIDDRWRDWLLAGACAGLGLLAKYSFALLLVPMLIWMVLEPRAVRRWRRPGPYLAVATMLLVVAPHLTWVAQHDWLPLSYASDRTSKLAASAGARLLNLLVFLGFQVLNLLPLGIVLVAGRGHRRQLDAESNRFAGRYLLAVVLGPVAVHVALGLALGTRLCGLWGMPLWLGLGLWLLWLRPCRAGVRPRLAIALVACNLAALAALPVQTALIQAGYFVPLRCHFPGQALAQVADRLWREHQPGAIPAVAGNNWLAGNIGVYAPGRPRVFSSADPSDGSPWCCYSAAADDTEFRQRGGVLVWDTADWGSQLPAQLAERFPAAGQPVVLHLDGHPTPVALAVVPPAPSSTGVSAQEKIKP